MRYPSSATVGLLNVVAVFDWPILTWLASPVTDRTPPRPSPDRLNLGGTMAQLRNVALGSPRTVEDGCRRYRPIALTFDARNTTLEHEIGDDWDPDIQKQWRSNQASIRMGLLGELGTVGGESKIENYVLMGSAPWSIIFRHNQMLAQIRGAFAHGDFYPALLGACGLGERLLNELLNVLR